MVQRLGKWNCVDFNFRLGLHDFQLRCQGQIAYVATLAFYAVHLDGLSRPGGLQGILLAM